MTSTAFLFALLPLLTAGARAQQASTAPWRFAVSGDSRNCGDVVMPSIARAARRDGAQFYWHLGDLRASYMIDEDIAALRGKMSTGVYHAVEWNDFIAHQIAPFGDMPFFIGIGNHEVIPPMTRERFVLHFADWLNAPELRAQRLADDPADHWLKPYYHWKRGGVDFITLDNATADQFDDDQLAWLDGVLARDRSDASVKGVVVGMHRALPNSRSCGHSMNETVRGVASGRRVYRALLAWTRESGKPVSVVASHSHFVMDRLYDTPYWRRKDRGVLPGWINGAAGAVRYPLPKELGEGQFAKTGVYGYLLGEASPDGSVSYSFREVARADVPEEVVKEFGAKLVDFCYAQNQSFDPPAPPDPTCADE